MNDYALFDLSDFPLVIWRSAGLAEGYSARWISDMDRLLERGQLFILLFPDQNDSEAHTDQKARGLWLKANRSSFARLCRAIISIEPDADRRAKRQAQGTALAQAFGTTILIASSEAEAFAEATRLISDIS
jgi:hypothetical protein